MISEESLYRLSKVYNELETMLSDIDDENQKRTLDFVKEIREIIASLSDGDDYETARHRFNEALESLELEDEKRYWIL